MKRRRASSGVSLAAAVYIALAASSACNSASNDHGSTTPQSNGTEGGASNARTSGSNDASVGDGGSESAPREGGDSASNEDVVPTGTTSPSCLANAPGAGHDCGSTHDGDCCGSPGPIGGSFKRSFDGTTFTNAGYSATVSPFELDTYEITVGRFRAFVSAGMGTKKKPPAAGAGAHPLISGSGWDPAWNDELPEDTASLKSHIGCNSTYQTWTDEPGPNEHRALNCLNWFDTFAFCIWDGKRLPTEAEWNYAASGGDEQRVFPWSQPATSTGVTTDNASYNVGEPNQCMGDGVAGCSMTDVLGVGSKPAGDGKWKHADLGGNVWEWALDWFADRYPSADCKDCANLTATTQRVVRGGGYFSAASYMRAAYREGYTPVARDGGFGGRCARSAR